MEPDKNERKRISKNSFEKFTSHAFKKKLEKENPELLTSFRVYASDRKYNFWLRDPLGVKIFSRDMALQKLNYMHTTALEIMQRCGRIQVFLSVIL